MPRSEGPLRIISIHHHGPAIDENGIPATLSIDRASHAHLNDTNLPKAHGKTRWRLDNPKTPNLIYVTGEQEIPKAKETDTKTVEPNIEESTVSYVANDIKEYSEEPIVGQTKKMARYIILCAGMDIRLWMTQ